MRVLISGAGVAGPSLVCFLAKTGARITILEKTASPLPHGQNVDITGSAITAVKKMGLLDEFRRNHTKEQGTQLIDPKGRPFAPFPVQQGTSTSFTSEYEILRGDLAKILYEASKDHPNVNYMFSTTVKEVISNTSEAVKVELSNGEVQEFDLLVAADGQWSKLRQKCFPPESVSVIDKGMYCVYYTVPRLPADNNWWNVYFALGSRVITIRPDPHGTVRAMFTCMPCNEVQKKAWSEAKRSGRKTQQELLRREFADAGWQAQRLLDAMDEAPDFYFQSMEQIQMTKWSNSRVICLGDTAYAPTPLTGMGTTLAITGAYILAGELNKLREGEHPAAAFRAYESTFHPFVNRIQDIPWFSPGIGHPKTAVNRWLLHSLIWTLSKAVQIPWVASKITQGDSESNDEGFPLPAYPLLDETLAGSTSGGRLC